MQTLLLSAAGVQQEMKGAVTSRPSCCAIPPCTPPPDSSACSQGESPSSHDWILDEARAGQTTCRGECKRCSLVAVFPARDPEPRLYECQLCEALVPTLVSIRVGEIWIHLCAECLEQQGKEPVSSST